MNEYVRYYHRDRTHRALAKGTPGEREAVSGSGEDSKIIPMPRLGGPHHRYGLAASDRFRQIPNEAGESEQERALDGASSPVLQHLQFDLKSQTTLLDFKNSAKTASKFTKQVLVIAGWSFGEAQGLGALSLAWRSLEKSQLSKEIGFTENTLQSWSVLRSAR